MRATIVRYRRALPLGMPMLGVTACGAASTMPTTAPRTVANAQLGVVVGGATPLGCRYRIVATGLQANTQFAELRAGSTYRYASDGSTLTTPAYPIICSAQSGPVLPLSVTRMRSPFSGVVGWIDDPRALR